ncbi:hypothetical protein Hanom_Chr06g00566061 [Helianthus anomalus]
MSMPWRVLYTFEQIISEEGLDFNLSELSRLYNLVSHGSHRFLFKAKPQQPLPLFKTTTNDTSWRNQFFFVTRDTIPLGNSLPKKWTLKGTLWILRLGLPRVLFYVRITDPDLFTCAVTNFSSLAVHLATEQRIVAFWALDSTIRTFKLKAKDLEDTTSTSFTMSSAPRSASKSASKFDPSDIDSMIFPRSIKRELARGQSQPEPKVMTTRAKTRFKRKKPSDPEEHSFQIERQFHDFVTEIRIPDPHFFVF